jgi:hypothetical protein
MVVKLLAKSYYDFYALYTMAIQDEIEYNLRLSLVIVSDANGSRSGGGMRKRVAAP